MIQEGAAEAVRPVANRIGIAALNFPVPGLGLLRVQRPRAAVVLLVVPTMLFAVLIVLFATLPTLDFRAWLAILLPAGIVILIVYGAAIVMSWRASRLVQRPGPWWSRWYGVAAIWASVIAADWAATDILLGYYRNFYIASESMTPTLRKGDRFVARMRRPDPLNRGDIVLFQTPAGHIYVQRIAALPGDRIEMVEGVVILNGRPVARRFVRSEPFAASFGPARTAVRMSEQFPGEAAPHEIYDTGPSPGDDMQPVLVPPGHVFLLGDNRDNSADSRFPADVAAMGAGGPVALGKIRGLPLFYTSWDRLGEPVHH